MLYEVDWAEDGTYRPGEFNSPEKFFNDCLENSKEFDLQLGYFSSATISVLAEWEDGLDIGLRRYIAISILIATDSNV